MVEEGDKENLTIVSGEGAGEQANFSVGGSDKRGDEDIGSLGRRSKKASDAGYDLL